MTENQDKTSLLLGHEFEPNINAPESCAVNISTSQTLGNIHLCTQPASAHKAEEGEPIDLMQALKDALVKRGGLYQPPAPEPAPVEPFQIGPGQDDDDYGTEPLAPELADKAGARPDQEDRILYYLLGKGLDIRLITEFRERAEAAARAEEAAIWKREYDVASRAINELADLLQRIKTLHVHAVAAAKGEFSDEVIGWCERALAAGAEEVKP